MFFKKFLNQYTNSSNQYILYIIVIYNKLEAMNVKDLLTFLGITLVRK
jgi:hypothetical protein